MHCATGDVDVSLVDRGPGILWEGEGRYDRSWHNHLELNIDKDSQVEFLAGATSMIVEPQPSQAAVAETPGPKPKNEL